MLDIVAGYHCMQFQGKHMIQTKENGKKPHFRPNSGSLGPNSACQIFFFKNLALSVTRYYGQLSSCTISEKTNDSIVRQVYGQTDGWMDGQTDGWMGRRTDRRTDRQTDESDFIAHCWTNVERPIINKSFSKIRQ